MVGKKKMKIEPPPILEKLLNLINLVKHGTRLPDANEVVRRIYPDANSADLRIKRRMHSFVSSANILSFDFHKVIETIKNETKSYPTLIEDITKRLDDISGIKCPPDDYLLHYLYYIDFTKIRFRLFHIVAVKEAVLKNGSDSQRDELNIHLEDIDSNTQLSVNADGKYSFDKDILELSLQDVDCDRLRICRKCKRLFWARRIDKFGCSKKCGDSIRTQRKLKMDAERFPSRVKRD